jgi:hypothetical protein
MNQIPAPVAGAISIALIVALGIFVYPWLLAQRYGGWAVALITPLLGILFVAFQGSSSSTTSLVAAGAWALAPVVAGVVVHRLQRKGG